MAALLRRFMDEVLPHTDAAAAAGALYLPTSIWLAQVDVLSRQAALAEVLQHRIADQEDVLQQLQNELEHVDAQRVRFLRLQHAGCLLHVGCACCLLAC